MAWQEIKGQELAQARLVRALQRGQVAHAYLFVGPEGVGKRKMALELAGVLLCRQPGPEGRCGHCASCHKLAAGNHADVIRVEPAGATVKIDQMRAMAKEMHLQPVESTRRVAIIDAAEKMGIEAANSVLKLLEEPPAYAVFVLVTSNLAAVLPTIQSRCQMVTFQPLAQPIIIDALVQRGIAGDQAVALALLSAGSLSRAIALADDPGSGQRRDEVKSLLDRLPKLDEADLLAVAEAWDKQKDVDLAEYLDLLVLWLRETAVWAATGDPQRLLAPQNRVLVATLAERYGIDGLTAMLARVEEARRQLKRNANARLVLDVLLLGLAEGPLASQAF